MALLILCMILVPLCIGNGVLRVIYRKKAAADFGAADAWLIGEIAVIGVAEAAHLGCVFAGWSFSREATVFGIAAGVLALAGLAAAFFPRAGKGLGPFLRRFRQGSRQELVLLLLFGVLVLSQVVYILSGKGIYCDGDMTAETVGSFLYTDRVYEVNPMTGADYVGGVPLRLKILCLPGLYGALCRLFALQPAEVVWKAIPLATLAGGYCAFSCLGRCLFAEDGKKRYCFLVLTALLVWAGKYALWMDGFGILCSGWRGVVIRNTVLVPYAVSLCLRRRWVPVVLCIAAEACIAWTLYGAGICLLTAVSLLAVRFVLQKAETPDGKEAAS